MSSDWTEVKLEDVVSILGDGLHGTPNYDENGEYYFINGNNLGDGKITIDEKTKRASKEEYFRHKKNLNDRTILVSINGTIGNVGLYNGEKVFLGKSACYFNVLENVDKQFIRYVVTDRNFQNYINSLATGSTIKNVSLRLMRDYAFRLPPFSVQKQISKVLEDLDSKLELNRRINETLETIARAIFKSWFVDFDPVRAKAGGEPPESICRRLGLTPDLLALFPDRLVDSELGEIPEGWVVQQLVQLSEKISKGTTPTKQDIASATDVPNVSFIKVKDINDRGEIIRDGLELIPESVHKGALKRSILEAGDILFSIAGTIGRIAIVEPDLANSNTNQAVAFVRLKDNAAHFGLCLQHLQSDRIQEAASASVVQAVQANVSLASLGAFKIVVPEAGVLELWNQTFGGLFNKTRICAAESRTLAAIRDALLPKLLSGELRVPVAGAV